MRAMSEKKKDMQIRIFTEKLCIVLIICGAMFLIAGWISDWLWQGMFAAIYGQHTGDTGIAGMATDPVIIGEYATLKPRINLVMYLIPWTFYALGCGAIVIGVAGQLLDITYEGICRIFRKLRAKQHVSR